jgi:ATP diphosphatase
MSDAQAALRDLLALMARLRDPQRGCPWDLQQTFASIAPFTIEEAYEVADAIERDDREHLRDELGDLLFQVVFHAQMAQERGWFDFAAVATAIHDKLVRRHPHVFAGTQPTPAELERIWEEQKARERAATDRGAKGSAVLGDVPRALPALARAAKLSRRAARVGFDWADSAQVRAKVLEEIAEVDAAIPTGAAATADEIGDLLFAVVNWSRHLGADAEECLRGANNKFERRFAHMEAAARAQGLALENLSAAEWDRLWRAAKLNGG